MKQKQTFRTRLRKSQNRSRQLRERLAAIERALGIIEEDLRGVIAWRPRDDWSEGQGMWEWEPEDADDEPYQETGDERAERLEEGIDLTLARFFIIQSIIKSATKSVDWSSVLWTPNAQIRFDQQPTKKDATKKETA